MSVAAMTLRPLPLHLDCCANGARDANAEKPHSTTRAPLLLGLSVGARLHRPRPHRGKTDPAGAAAAAGAAAEVAGAVVWAEVVVVDDAAAAALVYAVALAGGGKMPVAARLVAVAANGGCV